MKSVIGVIPWPGKLTALFGAIVGGLCSMLGGWSPAMTTLVIIAGLDVLSGLARAAVQGELSSKISWAGGVRKVLMFVVIMLAAQVDVLVGSEAVVRNATIIFYCVSEGLSVLENVVAAGLPVPDLIKDALAQLAPDKTKAPQDHE